MILGFDIGNTSTLLGLYRDGEVLPFSTLRYNTNKMSYPDDLWRDISGFVDDSPDINAEEITGLAYSSVVPELNRAYDEMSLDRFGLRALCICHQSRLSIRLKYDDPSRLGVDRIVNAEAVFMEHPGDSIIIDIGTAATIDVLLAEGIFDGGLIAPGIGVTIKALAENTSRLPAVPFERPDRLISRDTRNAIKSGFFYGWLSLIEGIIVRIEKEYGKEFRVIFTGGLSGPVVSAMERPVVFDPLLTMKGIKYIYDSNI
jgi:type III pantothenate kinase